VPRRLKVFQHQAALRPNLTFIDLNGQIVFETNEVSFHGVTAVKCPEGRARKSFAAYYYTKEAPAHWTGEAHSTM